MEASGVFANTNNVPHEVIETSFNLRKSPMCSVEELTLKLGDTIGEGSFACVRQGMWLGYPVAVKTMKREEEFTNAMVREQAFRDFCNEIRVNAILGSHPNIVSYFGTCCSSGNDPERADGIIFEHIPRGRIDLSVFRGGARMESAANVALGVARALAHAHRLGIMHRDVKPSNILITECGVPKLGDWGLAEFISRRNKSRDTGTAEFMAPEVYLGNVEYDEKADIFSFGILMYALGTGHTYPYESLFITPTQAVLAVSEKGLRPRIPKYLDSDYTLLMQKCWSEEPRDRPAIADVAMSLCHVLDKVREQQKVNDSSQSWSSWLGF